MWYSFDHLHPNIIMHILHTVCDTSAKVLTRRICLTIKSLFSWWSFPLFLWLKCVIQGWYCREHLDANYQKVLLGVKGWSREWTSALSYMVDEVSLKGSLLSKSQTIISLVFRMVKRICTWNKISTKSWYVTFTFLVHRHNIPTKRFWNY